MKGTFSDFDDSYEVQVQGRDDERAVQVRRNARVIFDGPAAQLVQRGEYYAISVDNGLKERIDTRPREMIGAIVDSRREVFTSIVFTDEAT